MTLDGHSFGTSFTLPGNGAEVCRRKKFLTQPDGRGLISKPTHIFHASRQFRLGEQRKKEETGCEINCGAPTALAVKGQVR